MTRHEVLDYLDKAMAQIRKMTDDEFDYTFLELHIERDFWTREVEANMVLDFDGPLDDVITG